MRNLGSRATVIHGSGVWGHPAVQASGHLNRAGIRCISIVGSYTTYFDESWSQLPQPCARAGIRLHAMYAFEQAWICTVISRYERFGYRNANRILVNYRSVERMIKNRFGSDLPRELVPYTIEKEFELRNKLRQTHASRATQRQSSSASPATCRVKASMYCCAHSKL